jgi:hypothetical protein
MSYREAEFAAKRHGGRKRALPPSGIRTLSYFANNRRTATSMAFRIGLRAPRAAPDRPLQKQLFF